MGQKMVFSKIVYTLKPSGASLWGVRLVVGWIAVTILGLAFDVLAGGCNATRCDLFISIFTSTPGIPLFAVVWMLLHVLFGPFSASAVLMQLLMYLFALMTLYGLGAFAEYVYYK